MKMQHDNSFRTSLLMETFNKTVLHKNDRFRIHIPNALPNSRQILLDLSVSFL